MVVACLQLKGAFYESITRCQFHTVHVDMQDLIAVMGKQLVGAVVGFGCQGTGNPGADTRLRPCSHVRLDGRSIYASQPLKMMIVLLNSSSTVK